MWILVLQRILLEFFWDLVYFPIWWYSGGMKKAGLFCYHLFQDANMFLAPGLWLKNIFVPMYGQRDLQGRLVSVLVRIGNIIIRFLGLLIWLLVVFFIFLIYLVFPVFLIYLFSL